MNTHYQSPMVTPKTPRDGLCNFVRSIINCLARPDGEEDVAEALYLAVDLLDSLSGESCPYFATSDRVDEKTLEAMRDEHRKEIGLERADAYQEGKRAALAAVKLAISTA